MLELLQIISVGVLLVLSFIYSGSEVALFTIPKFEHSRLSDLKGRNTGRLLHYLRHPQKALVTVLIGNMVVNSSAAIIGEHVTKSFFQENSLFFSVFIMTFLLLLFGEIVPKNVAVTRPIHFSRSFIQLLHLTNRVFFPIQFLVQLLIKRSSGFKAKHTLTKDELLTAVESGTEAGIPSTSISALSNLIHLINRPVSDIMVTRSEIRGVEINDYWRNMEKRVKAYPYASVLFFDDTIDHILGYIKVRDFIQLRKKDIRQNLVKPLFIPETKHILPMLSEFKKTRNYLAVVLDEYGGTSGIITLRDILDAIFIRDILVDKHIQKKSDTRWHVRGDATISDINSMLHLSLPVESNTISGYLLNILGEIPPVGTAMNIKGGYLIRVLERSPRQIENVEFRKL
jgi:CBS domain containing-hemolysin-like protein